jgi:hypothetical protein
MFSVDLSTILKSLLFLINVFFLQYSRGRLIMFVFHFKVNLQVLGLRTEREKKMRLEDI